MKQVPLTVLISVPDDVSESAAADQFADDVAEFRNIASQEGWGIGSAWSVIGVSVKVKP